MEMKKKIESAFLWIEKLFTTNHKCLSCGIERRDTNDYSLCDECLQKFVAIKGTTCKKCGEMVVEGNIVCDRCKHTEFGFDKNVSFCEYNSISARIVKKLKYDGVKYLANEIATLMSQKLGEFGEIDYVSFVPLSKNRLAERGFNQSVLIAKCYSKINNIELIDSLDRRENEIHQAGLSARDRMKNISGAFLVKEKAKDKIKGKTVLIIDDVFTTGATLSECAKTLKDAGTKCVYTTTFAKTELNKL